LRLILDCETNGLKNPDKIHCIVVKDIDNGDIYTFTREQCYREFPRFFRRHVSFVVGHNCIGYDLPVLRRLLGISIDPVLVHDSLVISRLLEYTLEGGHSLESWGARLGIAKVGVDISDWSVFTPEMLERCISDCNINHALYDYLLQKARIDYRDKFRKAITLEHEVAWICQDMHENGFGFNIEKAKELYEEIKAKVEAIDVHLQEAFPPKIEYKQLKTKVKEIVTPFNPSSPKQIVERLKPYWTPTEFTEKGHPKVSETNLATLSVEAPEAARVLVERLLLASRVRTLDQWFNAYNDRTRSIHCDFIGLGTWTHRLAHKNPNLGNVAAPKSIKYKGKVLAELAKSYGGRMRELWCVEGEDEWLIGTDAEGIQLRIFAHYINDPQFTTALISGKKELGTDAHSLNAAILGVTRDTAKTFIYAFFFGAGNRKIGEILGCSASKARYAKERFISAYPGLAKLKQENIPKDAARGYIEGFDGRLVKVDSEHHVMPAYLQTGEKVIMATANVIWRKELGARGIQYKHVNWVHDEWQTVFRGREEDAVLLGELQANSINEAGKLLRLRCPMAGEYKVGKNWLDTH